MRGGERGSGRAGMGEVLGWIASQEMIGGGELDHRVEGRAVESERKGKGEAQAALGRCVLAAEGCKLARRVLADWKYSTRQPTPSINRRGDAEMERGRDNQLMD